MASSLDSQLDQLNSRLEIQDLLARYTIALDTRDLELLRLVFTDDVEVDFGSFGGGKGVDWFIDFTRAGLKACGPTYHMLGQSLVTIDGTSATGRTYLVAQHLGIGELEGEIFTVAGWHLDTLALTDAGWRVASRRVEIIWTQGDSRIVTG
jgi:hypothetical protein